MTGRRGPHHQRALPFTFGGAKRNALDERLAQIRAAAEAGEPHAALLLGEMLWSSAEQRCEGGAWLRRAASAGQAEVLHVLGQACLRGQGIEEDLEARRLKGRAEEGGVVAAQLELSLMLARGIGGKRDPRGAARREAKAAEAGHSRACPNRAAQLASAGKPDFAAAIRCHDRASAGGSSEAAARLCKMQFVKQGVARDEAAARHWYERAVELGHEWSYAASAAVPSRR